MIRLISARQWMAVPALVATVATSLAAQDTTRTAAESRANLARRGAGVLIGSWSMVDNPATGGAATSDSPIGEGYFRKGIDKHLALETTVSVWRREITAPATGGLGGSPGGKTTAVLIPQLTSLRVYPFTTPDQSVEPFISGGVGFTLGYQGQSGGGGLLGGGGGASGIIVGVGGTGGAGVEWHFSNAFGLVLGGHYTYLQFFDDLAGARLYRGTGAKAGITYRFQY